MKHILIAILAFSFIYIRTYAQTRDTEYIFKYSSVKVDKYDLKAEARIVDANKVYLGVKGSRLVVVSVKTDLVVFQLKALKFNDSNNNDGNNVHFLDKTDSNGFFCMDKDKFNEECTDKFINTVSGYVDAIVLPFKFRFGNNNGGEFDFTQSVSVGGALAFNIGGSYLSSTYNNNNYVIIIGLNATSVSVDEKTVPTVFTSKSTALGISPFGGFNIVRGKLSFGVLVGWDVLTGKAGRNWVYRDSPWVGLSIGTSIISSK